MEWMLRALQYNCLYFSSIASACGRFFSALLLSYNNNKCEQRAPSANNARWTKTKKIFRVMFSWLFFIFIFFSIFFFLSLACSVCFIYLGECLFYTLHIDWNNLHLVVCVCGVYSAAACAVSVCARGCPVWCMSVCIIVLNTFRVYFFFMRPKFTAALGLWQAKKSGRWNREKWFIIWRTRTGIKHAEKNGVKSDMLLKCV